jgi:hypothetical protein
MNRKILVIFINVNELNDVIEMLDAEFNIKYDKIFKYSIEGDEVNMIITMLINPNYVNPRDVINCFKNCVHVHKKKNTLYTINALKLAIERDYNLEGGNINHKEYNLDWSKYENSLILSKNNVLNRFNIKKM